MIRVLGDGRLHRVRFTLKRTRCRLHRVRFTLQRTRCRLYRVRCTLQRTRCRLYRVRCTLKGTRCRLHRVRCTLKGTRCRLHRVRCTLKGTRCRLHRVRCTLKGTRCRLHRVRCTLQRTRCRVYRVQCTLKRTPMQGVSLRRLGARATRPRPVRHSFGGAARQLLGGEPRALRLRECIAQDEIFGPLAPILRAAERLERGLAAASIGTSRARRSSSSAGPLGGMLPAP